MAKERHEVQIPMKDARLTDEVRRGTYANEVFIANMRDEVILDFVQTSLGAPNDPDSVQAEIVSRVIMSRGLAERVQRLFLAQDFSEADEMDSRTDSADRESA